MNPRPYSEVCARKGCGHPLDKHKLDDIKVWTRRNEDDEITSADMAFVMQCFAPCEGTGPVHQCHCQKFEANAPKPSPHQLRELP